MSCVSLFTTRSCPAGCPADCPAVSCGVLRIVIYNEKLSCRVSCRLSCNVLRCPAYRYLLRKAVLQGVLHQLDSGSDWPVRPLMQVDAQDWGAIWLKMCIFIPSCEERGHDTLWQTACAYNAEACAEHCPLARRTTTAHLLLFRFLKPQTG